ncbi:hypothetical protein KKF84_13870 [Myxococcota bacterium]|nr:hypothetical protein [Myxococcota bacterium]
MTKRLLITLFTGAILGVFCILGAQNRFGGALGASYMFAFWFNRLLMGLVFGLMPPSKDFRVLILRGAIMGLVVSFAFYSATEFRDLAGFLVGMVYGVIIEFAAFTLGKKLVSHPAR